MQKRERLRKIAAAKAAGKKPDASTKPYFVKCGLNHVTKLIEQKRASLVVISHDVEPLELVMWLPTLCRKMDVPYCIIKSKARLGTVVHKKTATCLAFTDVKTEDKQAFQTLSEAIRKNYNDKYEETRKQWGGGLVSGASMDAKTKREEARAAKKI